VTNIAIAGSHGLIGSALLRVLEADGHVVTRLARHEQNPEVLRGVDAVINLAGAKIDQRWTPSAKAEIRSSRVETTSRLAKMIAALPDGPRVFLSGSAIGIYGSRGDQLLDETSTLGDDFLASICKEWEAAASPASAAGVRVVNLRTGIVLSKNGGALARMLTPFRFGVGGKLGSGKQWMSWIALADIVAAISFLLSADVRGPVNLVAPSPATNEQLTHALSNELHRPSMFSVPKFALKIAFGQMGEEAVLASQRVLPRRLTEAGFQFRFPTIEPALASALA
jgi:uncharacterized protein (TIGR01777 family)